MSDNQGMSSSTEGTAKPKKCVWTPDNIVKSPFKDVVIPKCTIDQYVWKRMEKWADKTAIICGITKRSYTYSQLYNLSRNVAVQLRVQFQIKDKDVVCIMMPNIPEYALAVFGIFEAGAVVTTVNPIYTAHEVYAQLLLSRPKLVICVSETVPIMREACKRANFNIQIITVTEPEESLPEGTKPFQELIENKCDLSILNDVVKDYKDVAMLPYSSGTTGLPKGVELTHFNIVANCAQTDGDDVKHYRETTNDFQESVICVLPFFHAYGMLVIMIPKLAVGVKLVTLRKFQPDTFLSVFHEQKITLLYAAPPLVLFLVSHPSVKPEDLESLETVICGAAPLPNSDVQKLRKITKESLEFLQLYGLTEVSPIATIMSLGSRDYTKSGYALPNTELRIVDSNLKNLGPDELGEVLIKGPQVMKGYRNNPKGTKDTITEDGWLRSGDLAKIDKDGAITIADRIKELIKVKGYQVPPAELESVIKEHPNVEDAAVVGIPDPRRGEAPKAFIVLKAGEKVEAKEIQDFVQKRVAEYKRVKEVVFMDSLPKTPSGKILRRELKLL